MREIYEHQYSDKKVQERLLYLNVINPHKIRASKGDSVSSPNILWVQLSDVNVLNDDVLVAIGNSETLSSDNTFGTDTDNRFVGADFERSNSGFIICY